MPEKVRLVDTPEAGKCETCEQCLPISRYEYADCAAQAQVLLARGFNQARGQRWQKYLGEYAACPWWEPEEE